ncbi:hypothetical protein [Humidisolicoccus flavus]|uniref:hypothetical protein n=1 Tax=Humidisolicoccus flavus TaxID=3111414 RepID=UPI00324F7ACD
MRATTSPYWQHPSREYARLHVDLVANSPLKLKETFEYEKAGKGAREIVTVSKWRGAYFATKSQASAAVIASAYVVSDTPATSDVIVIHYGKGAFGRQASAAVYARPHVPIEIARKIVSQDTRSFELSIDEFWRLHWFDAHELASSASGNPSDND